jgi:hypothetical protein
MQNTERTRCKEIAEESKINRNWIDQIDLLVVFDLNQSQLGKVCSFSVEFGIQRIKLAHAILGLIVFFCVIRMIVGLHPEQGSWINFGFEGTGQWEGPNLVGFVVPFLVGLLVGPWLDLQHWQRAIQMHREKTSIRASYIFGGIIFFLLLIVHGCLASWVMGNSA